MSILINNSYSLLQSALAFLLGVLIINYVKKRNISISDIFMYQSINIFKIANNENIIWWKIANKLFLSLFQTL